MIAIYWNACTEADDIPPTVNKVKKEKRKKKGRCLEKATSN